MQAPTAAALLLAWEHGLALSPTRRALALLGAALPALAPQQLAAMPVGARDAALLRLRGALFGDAIAAVAVCPGCHAPLDVGFNASALWPAGCDDADGLGAPAVHCLRAHHADIDYRLPTSEDVLAVAGCADAARALLARCVLGARQHGGELAPEAFSDALAAALSQAIGDADPQACTELDLHCPACGHGWSALFDIPAFLWTEVHALVQRIVRDVHTLARAYGWREADILAMSAYRRELYLELAQT